MRGRGSKKSLAFAEDGLGVNNDEAYATLQSEFGRKDADVQDYINSLSGSD